MFLTLSVALSNLLGRALFWVLLFLRMRAFTLASTAHADHLLSAIGFILPNKRFSQQLSRQISINSETLLIQKVVNLKTSPLPAYEPQVFQDTQVLRHSRGGHTEFARQAADAEGFSGLLLGQQCNEVQPGFISESSKKAGQIAHLGHGSKTI